MYRNVLIATDGSELAQKALDHGMAMAQAINARVTVVTVSKQGIDAQRRPDTRRSPLIASRITNWQRSVSGDNCLRSAVRQ